MEYVNYKKIHRHNTRTHRLTVVEWPGGGITLDTMSRRDGGSWGGVSVFLTDAKAKRVLATLRGIYSRRKRR